MEKLFLKKDTIVKLTKVQKSHVVGGKATFKPEKDKTKPTTRKN